MTTYYNEIDPYAAQWTRNLIKAKAISDGIVDERSIQDVAPDDLKEFTRCHFFSGIAVWDYALRLAGWPDDRPVWTGSCPCQPFSAAGKGGGFDDERHLWPDWFWLIAQCRPAEVFGEQVASGDGLTWLDLVQPDLEGENYAVGAGDLCSASVGAPHIRQRLYWYAKRMANAERGGLQGRSVEPGTSQAGIIAAGGGAGRLGYADDARLEGFGRGHHTSGGRLGAARSATQASEPGGLADTTRSGRREERSNQGRSAAGDRAERLAAGLVDGSSDYGASPTNGFWRDADWLHCRDGKWRPVEPGTFPLAHGVASRVGRLRAYGNAVNAEVTAAFIAAAMRYRP